MTASFTIKQILSDHWSSFLSTNPNIRDVVITQVERVLGCGEPENGFAMYKCPACYIGRPTMAQSRIINYDDKNVTFWYHRHEDNKHTVETVSAFDFIKKLIVHIPDKGFNMLRYYGIYAKPATKTANLIRKFPSHIIAARKTLQRWSFCIEIAFGNDPLKCSCGNYMEFVDTYFPTVPANSS